jgi:hypothetical protein
LPDKGRWLHAEAIGGFSELAELGNRDSHRVNLRWICCTFAPALTGRWRNLAAFLSLSMFFCFGGLAGEQVTHALAHWPSSYCLISDRLAAQAVAPHHRVLGGESFGATMTVTTKPAVGENPVTLTVAPVLLPAERTHRRSSWQASVAHSVATLRSLVPFRSARRAGCAALESWSRTLRLTVIILVMSVPVDLWMIKH